MSARFPRSTRVAFAECLEGRRLLSVTYGTNLVQNGGAESFSGTADGFAVITPTDWTNGGATPATVSPYASGYGKEIAMPVPSGGGNDFFSGGSNTGPEGDFFQTIDLSSIASAIDSGKVQFTLSGFLGGNGSQGDNASVFVNFSDASSDFLSQSVIGPVTAANRGNTTEMLSRSTGATVPVGARTAQIQIHFEYSSGMYDDAFADEISFVVTNPSAGGSVSGTVTGGKTGETVYLDANNNSTLDSGELSTTTNASGQYSFSNVPAGAYIIRQILPSGYTQTSPASGYGIHITVTNGGSLTNENFTDKSTAGGSVSGTVTGGKTGETIYLDANNNSTLDSGELSTTTNSSGQYSFSNVPAGAYIIRQVLPSGYTQTNPASGYGIHITVTSGGSLTNENFTDKSTATGGSISGTVTGGKAGETVYLDANNNSKLDSGELSTTTNSSGQYSFSNVPAGAYIIRQVLPSGYTQTSPASGYGIHITVTNGGNLTNENFTDKAPASGATISGIVFDDLNSNGVQDSGESGLSGWALYIDLNNSDTFVTGDPAAITDSNGDFEFTGLAAGTYIVRVEIQSGYEQTSPADNYGQHVTVTAGQNLTGVKFGEVYAPIIIRG